MFLEGPEPDFGATKRELPARGESTAKKVV
jgi:hypothetical protein